MIVKFCTLAMAILTSVAVNAGGGTSIVDVQFNPTGAGESPLLGQVVTVSGIVTSSGEPDNLDQVHIQQPGEPQWAGIELRGNPDLGALIVGDAVTVTGRVAEDFGKTALESLTDIELTGSGTIQPTVVDPNLFTDYSVMETEAYESMLIQFTLPSDVVIVVEQNADGSNNFGDWRVGSDPATPMEGCRILTGRLDSFNRSSLNVSWINDLVWETNSGRMNVPAIVVEEGDKFESITGIMSYGSGEMRLLPRNNADVIPTVVLKDGFEVEE